MHYYTIHCPKWLNLSHEFTIVRKLFSNQNTDVYVGTYNTHQLVCVKKIKNGRGANAPCLELRISNSLNHPHLLKYYCQFRTQQNMYLVSEYCNRQDLFEYIHSETTPCSLTRSAIVKQIIMPLCRAVEELHIRDIVHNDIKPENIMLHDNQIKLGDYGLSLFLSEVTEDTPLNCTKEYMSPEFAIFKDSLKNANKKEFPADLKKHDIWCIGLTAYECMTKQNPTQLDNLDVSSLPSWIKQCLAVDPVTRPTILELIDML